MLGVSSVLKCSCLLLSCSQEIPSEEIQLPQSPAPTCRRVPTSCLRASGERAPEGRCAQLGDSRRLTAPATARARRRPEKQAELPAALGVRERQAPRLRASGDRPARPWHLASRRAPRPPRWCSLAAVAAAEGTASPRSRPGSAPLSPSFLLFPNRLVPATCLAASF